MRADGRRRAKGATGLGESTSSAAMNKQTDRARQEFARGLREKHPFVLVPAVGLVLAALLGVQWLFASGAFTALPERMVLRFDHDDYTHVIYELASLKRNPPKGLAIYLLGGSSARECIDSAGALAEQVSRETGLHVRAYNLASMNQSFAESMAIVDNLPRGPALVLVAVSANRFGVPARKDRQELAGENLVLESPSLRRFLVAESGQGLVPPTLLPGIMNYALSYYEKHARRLANGKPLFVPYTHGYTRGFDLSVKRAFVRVWLKGYRGESFTANFAYNSRLLDSLLSAGQRRGFHMVLFETPENREIVQHAYDAVKAIYQPRCAALAAAHGTRYLNFVDDAGLHNADFRDLTHLLKGSRAKFRRYLGNEVSHLVRSWFGATAVAAGG